MGEKEACPDKTVIIDIPEDLEPDLNKTCWIQRVPRNLRKVKEAAYTPKMVSIGPFHHGNPTLNAMENHKIKYYHKFWERNFCKHIREKDMMRDFISGGDRPKRIRNSYAGTFDQAVNDVDRFLKVILRDSCFIFELFLRNYEYLLYIEECRLQKKNPEDITDYILRTPWLRGAMEMDLIMVENQLPYFVFTELFDFILQNQPENQPENLNIPPYLSKHQEESERHHFITKITWEFFDYYYWNGKVVEEEERKDGKGLFKCFTSLLCCSNNEPPRLVENSVRFAADLFEPKEMQRFKEIKHFTDLVRQFMLPNKRPNYYVCGSEYDNWCYSAKELDRAGVELVSCSNKFLAEIEFKKGKILEVPRFQVEDTTECLIRNVMALEQCLYPYEAHICNYIAMLDKLINTEEDVELLVQKKVVYNWLGSNNAVADLINTLCDEIAETSFCYGDICRKLNTLHENCWNVAKATLKRVYFKDIWTGSSTIVAVVVLIFSIVSVIATIKDSFI